MESPESVVVHGSLDRYDGRRKCKSNLKRNSSFNSSCEPSGNASHHNGNPMSRRVHFRETIDVFSDGEETVTIPLNDDFTLFPSLRSPLRRFVGRRQRGSPKYMQSSDLYMVGELYSNVPIIVLKKSVKATPNSIDLIAPLATMDDMDLFDGFDDSDERPMNEWIDDVNDANDLYIYGSDDLSAESESEEVMDFLLRERCLSDEEDSEISQFNSDGSSMYEDDEVVIDVVTKEVLEADFFDEPNIEEIESSSSTDSVAETDSQYLSSCNAGSKDETEDFIDEPMEDLTSEDTPRIFPGDSLLPHEVVGITKSDEESDITLCFPANLQTEVNSFGPLQHDLEPMKADEYIVLDSVPSLTLCDHRFVEAVKNFPMGSAVKSGLIRSRSTDFKSAVSASLTGSDTKVSLMADSGFASLEMSDLESKNEAQTLAPAENIVDQQQCTKLSVTESAASSVSRDLLEANDLLEDSSSDRLPDTEAETRSMAFSEEFCKAERIAEDESSAPRVMAKTKFVESGMATLLMERILKQSPDNCISLQSPSISGQVVTHSVEVVPILTWLFKPPE